MVKINLPVILLNNLILPNNVFKVDIKLENDKGILDEAELFHDNQILIVYSKNTLDEVEAINKLPKIGTICKINKRIKLPDGTNRITITSLQRALVREYLYQDGTCESIASLIEKETLEEEIETALITKLNKEVEEYISLPNVSNSICAAIKKETSLDSLTDKIAANLMLENERLEQYLSCYNILKRTEMVLEDIYKLKELYTIENKLDIKVKNVIDKNQKEFYLKEKINVIKEELGQNSIRQDEVNDFLKRLNELIIDESSKNKIEEEINKYSNLLDNSLELSVFRNYIELLLSLPWNKKTHEEENLIKVKDELDKTHYGLDDVKLRIIEHLALLKFTDNSTSPIICLVGPPGVGKTTFASSIAKSMKSNFTKISVGGVNDAAEILGHRQTYLGASPGRIIEGMRKAGSANPVFLIDEVDKMSQDYKGDPAAALLEVLDYNQNKKFVDNFLKIEYDLSNVFFILTANDANDIPSYLRDRLEIINISGYTSLEKFKIAKEYLIPKISKECNLELKITDNALKKIIDEYTNEAGVRDLERKLRQIYRKVITKHFLDNVNLNEVKITPNLLSTYLGLKTIKNNYVLTEKAGVVNSLAYSNCGGIILPIEVLNMPGAGNLVVTGLMSDTMKESVYLALNYVKSNYKEFKIDKKVFFENDIHVHIPTEIKKDGLSAGVAILTAIISSLTNQKIKSNIAFTGEVTLTGRILKVGGLKEKISAAIKNGINKIFVPKENEQELEKIKSEYSQVEFVFVDDYLKIYDLLKEDRYAKNN